MKQLLFSITICLVSCSDQALTPEQIRQRALGFDNDNCPVKWQLTQMSGSIASIPPETGADMEWQEWYILYADSTFTKTRERDNRVTEASGTFSVRTDEHGTFVEFKHKSESGMIASCISGLSEVLVLTSDGRLAGTWSMCDGPGLVYERANYSCDERTE